MGIIVKDLSVKFGGSQIYENFNLSVGDGEFVCLLGKSGTGKTVLLKSILGVIDHGGEILVDEKTHNRPSKRVGMVYQDFFLLPWLTIRENIKLSGCSDEFLMKMSEMVQISEYLDFLPKNVSVGTKQRTAIARAFSTDANVILMDEPLCSVDAITGESIRKEILELCKGKSVIYVTHDIHEALRMSTRIVILGKNNKIVYDHANENEISVDEVISLINK